jgi:hypothetical protein
MVPGNNAAVFEENVDYPLHGIPSQNLPFIDTATKPRDALVILERGNPTCGIDFCNQEEHGVRADVYDSDSH